MADLIDLENIVRLHDASVDRWHQGPIVHDQRGELMKLVLANHAFNFELWHEEDKARDPAANDAVTAQVKRNIDGLNQKRNNAMEGMDEEVLKMLIKRMGPPDDQLPMHSETVGNIVDRLSILSLKIYHMREETQRQDAAEAHTNTCLDKLAVLVRQRGDLATALGRLCGELTRKEKRFAVYRQMKMYNDPSLNPVLYKKSP